jgi:hypothetical protein
MLKFKYNFLFLLSKENYQLYQKKVTITKVELGIF